MNFGAEGKQVHSFDQLPMAHIKRSSFDLSHQYTSAFDSADLIPFFVEEALPGDTFIVSANVFGRLSTPVVPVTTNIYMTTHFFAVAKRLLWSNFKKFYGEQINAGDSTSYTIPRVQSAASGFTIGSLYDYMGVGATVGQVAGANQVYVNNLAGRAYNQIYNTWYRHPYLNTAVTEDLGDGPDTLSNYTVLKRTKRPDYFTGCNPWPQRGTEVTLPLGTSAPVQQVSGTTAFGIFRTAATNAIVGEATIGNDGSGAVGNTSAAYKRYDPNGTLEANLSTAVAASINTWRTAVQTQAFYEIDARGGARFPEIILAHFGVASSDARMQRPEFLGGGKGRIVVSPVVQTNATGATGTPQGNMAAVAVGGGEGHGFTKSFEEPCIVMGIVSVTMDLLYQQGLSRMWTDQTRLDKYWPAFANLGEQAVLNREIYVDGSANDTLVFGYQERWAHLRYKPSLVTGKLRSTASGTLDVWHGAQKFTSLPTLGATFINEAPPISRLVAVNTEPQIIFDSWINFTAIRPMPVYSVPANLSTL
jgi:hypothetical protein